MSRYMTDEEKQTVLKMHDEGYNTVEISEAVGRNNTTIGRFLKKNGLHTDNKKKTFRPEQVKQICEMYELGRSTAALAEVYGTTGNTIASILKENGIDVRPRGQVPVLDNPNFFHEIDNEAKAYFLGFIIADGGVTDTRGVYRTLSIMLKKDDKYILDALAQCLGVEPERVKISSRNECYLKVNSLSLVADLAKYGVVPRKTYSSYLPSISKDLMPHLIRGIFDGDGSVFHSAGYLKVAQYGSHKICDDIQKFLTETIGTEPRTVYDKTNHSFIQYWKKEDVEKIYNYMYSNATIYLERKKDIFNCNIVNTEVTG
ncbi:hypothetical protein ACFU1R_06610 [Priestia megaterium]|uniref:helix-turn-helix domain-containing protein n=1 Tax=Priestia megaterium TaxID=1404 RepID=UPI0036716CF7